MAIAMTSKNVYNSGMGLRLSSGINGLVNMLMICKNGMKSNLNISNPKKTRTTCLWQVSLISSLGGNLVAHPLFVNEEKRRWQ